MSSDKNHSEQFEKYLKEEMSSKEANAFERKTLTDPFAQDALEGLEAHDSKLVLSDIKELQGKIFKNSKKGFAWMQIAAVVALLVVGSLTLWFSLNQVQVDSQEKLAAQEDTIPESVEMIANDSITIKESEELIAEAAPVIDEVKKVKKEGVKVVDKIELDDEEREEIKEAEVEPIMTLAEAEVSVEEITKETDNVQIETPLLKVIDVQIAEVEPGAFETNEISTKKLDSNLLAQSLAASDNSEESALDKTSPAFSKRKMGSQARSASSSIPTVSGKVTDDAGESLPGVNVIVKGAAIGTQTDLDGSYTLPKSEGMILLFAFVGFESQEVEAGARTSIDISMGGATELQEVVVTGYGVSDAESSPSYSPAKPSFGNRKFNNYLRENLQYPEQAKINKIEGTVTLELTVSPEGKISNIDIKKSLGYGCDEEAIRLINDGPKWQAAERNNVRTEDKVRVKVKFKL